MVDFQLYYEEHSSIRKGGKVIKMTKQLSSEASKASRKYAKTRGEHYKDIVIAVLIAAIIAFIGGMHFENQHNTDVSRATTVAQPTKK